MNRMLQFWFLIFIFGIPACAAVPPPPPTPRVWHGKQVIAAFQRAGLDAQITRYGAKDSDDGLAVMMVVQVTRFAMPSEGENARGIVFAFANLDDLAWHINFYLQLQDHDPSYAAWLFWRDNVLVWISKSVAEKTARRYEQALKEIK